MSAAGLRYEFQAILSYPGKVRNKGASQYRKQKYLHGACMCLKERRAERSREGGEQREVLSYLMWDEWKKKGNKNRHKERFNKLRVMGSLRLKKLCV